MNHKILLIKNGLCLLVVTLLALSCSSSCQQKKKVATPPSGTAPAIQSPPVPGYLFKMAIYGDTRSDPAHGDGPHQVHRHIVNQVMTFSPSLVLQTGDLVNRGTQPEEWQIFDDITAEMRQTVAYYPARGNHDVEPGGDNFQRRVTHPILSGNKLYYAFEKENVHFIAIDTEQSLNETDEQYRWLEDDLQKAAAAGKVIIPFFHKAIFSIGIHGSNMVLQTILHPLFVKYGVKVAFQGHDHNYYHTRRDGITYIVTGGGGAPLYPDRNRALAIEGDVFEKVHHFCIADVYQDRIEIAVYREDLSQIEAFTIQLN
jgi:3',5'-cyclic AMP phosphodiesterase CpdA